MIGLFIVLLAIYISKNHGQERAMEERKSQEEALVFPDFNPDAAASITITGLQTGIVKFEKEAGYWMVANGGEHPVMGEAVEEAASEPVEAGEEVATEEPSDGQKQIDEPDGELKAEGIVEVEAGNEPKAPEKKLHYYRADESQVVDGVLKMIKEMPHGIRVSTDKEKHNQFQVSSILAFDVDVRDLDGAELAHFLVGNAADQLSTENYIRFSEDSDEVYRIKGGWRNLVGKPFQAWRDKTIFFFDPAGISHITLYGTPDGDLAFTRGEDGEWSVDGQDWEVDKVRLDSLVSKLSTLKATDFAPTNVPPEKTGLASSVKKIVAEGSEGTFELTIGDASEAGKYYSSVTGDDTIYMLNDPDVSELLAGREKLAKVAPPENVEEPAVPAIGD